MVRSGRAVRITHRGTNDVVGYQLSAGPKVSELMRDRPPAVVVIQPASSTASSTAFSKAEVDAIVGLRGESVTAHLSDEQRAARILRLGRGEDIVESARKKLSVYRDVH